MGGNINIGIDMGGTKIAAIALAADGRVLGHLRVPTPPDYQGIIQGISGLVGQLRAEIKGSVSSIGICSPGVVDRENGVIRFSPNIPDLKDKPFVEDVSAVLAMPVRLANDAACFALSEACEGAGAGQRSVYGIILGTGVGGALVVDKKIPSGPNGATEWGHLPLPWADAADVPLRCGCGRIGDIESYLSGPALHRRLAKQFGRDIGNDEIAEGIVAKNPAMLEVMDAYLNQLAKALAMLVTIVDPDVIVIGGGVSNLDILYDEVPARIARYAISGGNKTKILKARFGDDSGLRGAARL